MEIANFFWDGELTKLEKFCIKSFVDNGFDSMGLTGIFTYKCS